MKRRSATPSDPTSCGIRTASPAALLVAELAAQLRAHGRTLLDRRGALQREYGVHATDEYAARVDDPARIPPVMARLRDRPPRALAGRRVVEIRDLLVDPGNLPPADVLVMHLDRGRMGDPSQRHGTQSQSLP